MRHPVTIPTPDGPCPATLLRPDGDTPLPAVILYMDAFYPDRIAAAASFHGGQLATDAPDSPHLLAPKIKATVYVAGADRDANYPPEQAQRLERALSDAGVPHRCETYEGALHGYAIKDHPVYNEAADARHWRELERLLASAFGK